MKLSRESLFLFFSKSFFPQALHPSGGAHAPSQSCYFPFELIQPFSVFCFFFRSPHISLNTIEAWKFFRQPMIASLPVKKLGTTPFLFRVFSPTFPRLTPFTLRLDFFSIISLPSSPSPPLGTFFSTLLYSLGLLFSPK